MRYLEERDIGYVTPFARVPIVPAAILFDLRLGDSRIRPDAQAGYQACVTATGRPCCRRKCGSRSRRNHWETATGTCR